MNWNERCQQALDTAVCYSWRPEHLRWLVQEGVVAEIALSLARTPGGYYDTHLSLLLGLSVTIYPDAAWGELFGYPILLQYHNQYLGVTRKQIDLIQMQEMRRDEK